jgi:colicin import membrane protein
VQVRTAEEAARAKEFLSQLAAEKRRSERARTALVKPLNDHVKFINAQFRPTTDALEVADGIVRRRILEYREEKERAAREEQERLDAERKQREEKAAEEHRRAEAEAAAERERAARDAAKAEADRRRAEAAAAEADREAATKLEREMRDMAPEGLDAEVRLTRNPKRKQAAEDELKRRAALQEAAAAAEREEEAKAAEAAAREAEQAAHDAPLPDVPEVQVAEPGTLRSPSGSASTRKTWTFEVEDPAKVPEAYKTVNEKAIREAVRRGERSIPGVRIFQETGLAVRAR